MRTYSNNTPAPYGVYFCARPLDMRFVGSDGEALEGKPGASYVRLPTLLVVALGPAIGGAFVILFPILVLVGLAGALAQVAVRAVGRVVDRHAHLARVRWEPATSYLHGEAEEEEEKEEEADEVGSEMEDLRQEVQARREADERGPDDST